MTCILLLQDVKREQVDQKVPFLPFWPTPILRSTPWPVFIESLENRCQIPFSPFKPQLCMYLFSPVENVVPLTYRTKHTDPYWNNHKRIYFLKNLLAYLNICYSKVITWEFPGHKGACKSVATGCIQTKTSHQTFWRKAEKVLKISPCLRNAPLPNVNWHTFKCHPCFCFILINLCNWLLLKCWVANV